MMHQSQAILVDDLFNRRILAVTFAAKQIQVAWVIRAADKVKNSVVVIVHELWTRCDASVNGRLGGFTAGLQHSL